MDGFTLPAQLYSLLSLFAAHGEAAYPVGGCVRDTLRGAAPHDWDVAVTTPPEVTQGLCEAAGLRVVPTGIKHGTVTVLLPQSGDLADRAGDYDPIECTTCRTEGGYSDGRHPDAVAFTGRIEDDLSRRDFTVNAMAFAVGPAGGVSVIDLFGGRADLSAGVIRCVGDPATRFSEDALRMLRAVRFAVQLGFAVDPATAAAVRALAPTLARISRERVTEEFAKILCSPDPARGVSLLDATGLLPHILPADLARDAAGAPATGDLASLPPELSLRLSCLLGGMDTALLSQNLATLRLPTATKETVRTLAAARPLPPAASAADARRLRRALGAMAIPALLVRRARAATAPEREALDRLVDLVRASEAAAEPVTVADLAISGDDLLALGFPPGKALGAVLLALLNLVLEDPTRNTPAALRAAALSRKP